MTISEQIIRAKADYDEVFEAGKRSVEATLKFTEVESTSYRTTAPNNVLPFAKVNKIGGMTHKTRNLIPFGSKSLTLNGVTFTPKEDGSIIVNGTATDYTAYELVKQGGAKSFTLSEGTTYTLSGCPQGGSSTTFDLHIQDLTYKQTIADYGSGASFSARFTGYYVFIVLRAGCVANNLVFRPMLNEGTTALPYEPYFEGLRNAEVTELKSHGVNYLDMSVLLNDVLVDNGDGTYSMITSADEPNKRFTIEAPLNIPLNTDVVIHGELLEGVAPTIRVGNDKKWGQTCSFNGKTWIRHSTAETPITKVQIYMQGDETGSLCKFKNPIIALGETLPTYKAYVGTIDTLPIPEAIKSLDGYGLGVNSEYYNYIGFYRNVFAQKVYRKVFDGTEAWSTQVLPSGNYRLNYNLDEPSIPCPAEHIAPLICSHYSILSGNDVWKSNVGAAISTGGGAFYVYDAEYGISDTSIWKAHLAELYANGNPLTIVYALANPIETDISAYLTDEYIEVEGGGTITAVNEYGLDAPTTISYLIDTQGG